MICIHLNCTLETNISIVDEQTIYIYVHIIIYNMYTNIYVYNNICIYICMYVYLYVYICVCVCYKTYLYMKNIDTLRFVYTSVGFNQPLQAQREHATRTFDQL